MKHNLSDLPDAALFRTQQGYAGFVNRFPVPAGDYLEVGPDRGILASILAQRHNFDGYWFMEPNILVHDSLREAVQPKPSSILTGFGAYDDIPTSSISLSVMVHVLDHLLDPLKHLVDIRRCMRPNGMLTIVVHNERSIPAKVFGKRTPIFNAFHPQLFNPSTLSAIVRKAGFEVVGIRRTYNHYPLTFAVNVLLQKFGLRNIPVPQLGWLRMPMPLGNIQLVAKACLSNKGG